MLLDSKLPRKLSRCSQAHSRAYPQGHSLLHWMAACQPAWIYTPKQALKTLSITLPSMPSCSLPIALNRTLPHCWTVHSKVSSQDALKHTPDDALMYTPNRTRWLSPILLDYTLPSKHSRYSQELRQVPTKVDLLDDCKYTLKTEATLNLTWLYSPMYAPACSIQRLDQLQMPATQRRAPGGIWWAEFGRQHVACAVW